MYRAKIECWLRLEWRADVFSKTCMKTSTTSLFKIDDTIQTPRHIRMAISTRASYIMRRNDAHWRPYYKQLLKQQG